MTPEPSSGGDRLNDMERRAFLALLASPAVAALLDAVPAGAAGIRPGAVPQPSNPGATPPAATDPLAAASAIGHLADSLYAALVAADPTANIIISPTSIAVALLMALAGARTQTADELATVLGVADQRAIPESYRALAASLAAAEADGVTFDMANSMWTQEGYRLLDGYTSTLATSYGVEARQVDFVGDAGGARMKINEWVDTETSHRIPELIGEGVLNDITRLVLVNAMYLKAAWSHEFNPELTRNAPFTTGAGTTVDAPTMPMTEDIDYAESGSWRAVRLPYVGGRFGLVVALPGPGEVTAPPAALFDGFSQRLVRLALPTFDVELATDLATQVAALGAPTAFDEDNADFSGITTEEPLFIGAVIHQANISVNEKGTEAGAATAVAMMAGAAPGPAPEPVSFVVDRPFSIAVHDSVTGTVLFVGRIADPTKRRR